MSPSVPAAKQRVYLCVGPSVFPQDLANLPSDFAVLPPVAHGDLLRLAPAPGEVVAIIDGYFHQAAAVRHKEILWLLKRGVRVVGAASMGALRAAELEPYGMRGYGRIFGAFVEGEIEGDDEVAVLHGTGENGYPAITEALVNTRHNLERALHLGICTAETAAGVLAAAEALPYMDRTYERILASARRSSPRADPVDRSELERLGAHLTASAEDIKRSDALLLIDTLLRDEARGSPALVDGCIPGAAASFHDTLCLRRWREEASGHDYEDVGFVSEIDALAFCQLYATDYPELQRHVALTALAGMYEARVAGDAEQNGGRPDLGDHPPGDHDDPPELHRAIVDYATHLGLIAGPNDLPELGSALAGWLTPAERRLPPDERFAIFGARSYPVSEGLAWRAPLLDDLRGRGKLAEALAGVREVRLFNRALKEAHPEFRSDIVKRERVIEWFARRWGVPIDSGVEFGQARGSGPAVEIGCDFDLALLDRGFPHVDQFVPRAQPFYLFDKLDGRYGNFRLASPRPVAC